MLLLVWSPVLTNTVTTEVCRGSCIQSFIGSICRKEFSTNSASLCTVACTANHRGTSQISVHQCPTSQLYSAFLGGSAMPAHHTRSTGLLCGRPVALELFARQLERSGSWKRQLQTSAEDAFIYTVLKGYPTLLHKKSFIVRVLYKYVLPFGH